MLKRGFLANTTLATTYAYNHKIIQKYLKETDNVFAKIRYHLKNKSLVLKGKVKHTTFKRLNA